MEKFKILQLCCFTNLWPASCSVISIDLKFKTSVFNVSQDYVNKFDLIAASPPCIQFTKANSSNWVIYPEHQINIALKCFELCVRSSKLWFLENPPGRIETFIPALKKYRVATWNGNIHKKEYVIYSNFLFLFPKSKRYSGNLSESSLSQNSRNKWKQDFINSMSFCLNL